jgi:hypothetical protein
LLALAHCSDFERTGSFAQRAEYRYGYDFLDMVLVGLFFEFQAVEKTIKSGNATQVDFDNFRSSEQMES